MWDDISGFPEDSIYIYSDTDADRLFEQLVQGAHQKTGLIVRSVMRNQMAYQACASFINRYKLFMEYSFMDFSDDIQGTLYIKLK